MYENKVGKGEDAIIGYTLYKSGKLFSVPSYYFVHNDQNDSTYSTDVKKFAIKVAFSRYYMSMEKTRLDNGNYALAKLHYNYYMLFRLLGYSINYLLNPSLVRKNVFIGSIIGWRMAIIFKFDKNQLISNKWFNEAEKDLI